MGELVWQDRKIKRQERETLLNQKACVIWLTGLPASGKSTIASELEKKLHELGRLTYVLDGDNIRHGLNSDLGFSQEDRVENIRRVGEVSALFADAGLITIVAFISPYQKDRDTVRENIGKKFIEVYVGCSVETAEERDPKGHYKMARDGRLSDFTGVTAPYETPINPEISLDTEKEDVGESVDKIVEHLKKGGYI